jgi:hypothetical protein
MKSERGSAKMGKWFHSGICRRSSYRRHQTSVSMQLAPQSTAILDTQTCSGRASQETCYVSPTKTNPLTMFSVRTIRNSQIHSAERLYWENNAFNKYEYVRHRCRTSSFALRNKWHPFTNFSDIVSSSGNASDLYARTAGFEYRPGHRLPWLTLYGSPKFLRAIYCLSLVTTHSVQILFSYLLIDLPFYSMHSEILRASLNKSWLKYPHWLIYCSRADCLVDENGSVMKLIQWCTQVTELRRNVCMIPSNLDERSVRDLL